MKTLVGVDLSGTFRLATRLCARMQVPDHSVQLLNVVETLPAAGWFAPTGYVPPSWDSELKAAGEAVLRAAEQDLKQGGLEATGRVVFGHPADALLMEADAGSVDLVAIGCSAKSPIERVLLGSVGRALAIASKHSVLIARPGADAAGGLRVVIGTDHSDYANECIDRFVGWNAKGLEAIHLVTAVHLDPGEEEVMRRHLPLVGQHPLDWIEEETRKRSSEVESKLTSRGFHVQAHIQRGPPNDVLHHAMHAFRGDVLLVGGQGHGFVDQLTLGSVTMHQAVAEPYSVLILRP